eukprot:gene5293-470_t
MLEAMAHAVRLTLIGLINASASLHSAHVVVAPSDPLALRGNRSAMLSGVERAVLACVDGSEPGCVRAAPAVFRRSRCAWKWIYALPSMDLHDGPAGPSLPVLSAFVDPGTRDASLRSL